MIKSLSVLLSDRISKTGVRFTISAMEDIVWKKSINGVPMHLGHDMHRPIGVMKSIGLYFESDLVRNIGLCLIPETDEEVKQVIDFKKYSHVSHVKELIDTNNDSLYNQVKDYIENDYDYLEVGTLAILNKNIVKRIFPSIHNFSESDKNNLINIKDLEKDFDYKYQGIFIHKKLPLCIFCHQFFRRSLSHLNNFHYIFLDELLSHKGNEDIQIKISIDWNLIGYAPDVLQGMEFEYWFGPKYDDDISNIHNGLTKHSTNQFERDYYGISTTEFFWKSNDNLKEFEMEELRESESPTEKDFFGCRYIHSIYDMKRSNFIHFDGAIRGYDSNLYLDRLDHNMTEFGRKSQYEKLFRVDGKLPLSSWKSLVTNYMQDNPLIYEYFGIDKPVSQFETTKESPSLIEELIPNKMDKEDGIKVLVSYHEKNEKFKNQTHAVSIYDCMTIDEKQVDILEDEIIELKKTLKKRGKQLFINDDTIFVNCKDEYWNIPCIFHAAENPQEDINDTILALKSIFHQKVIRKLKTNISFSISWNIEDKEIIISCIGNVENLLNWLNSFNTIPITRVNLKLWLESLRDYLNKNSTGNIDKPSINNLCQYDGVLYFKRKVVGEEFKITPYVDDEALKYTMTIPNNDEIKYKAIINQEIMPAMSYINKFSRCNKCKGNYFECDHSKWFDKDCHLIVEKIEALSFYWTDKVII